MAIERHRILVGVAVLIVGQLSACGDEADQSSRCKFTDWFAAPSCGDGLVCNEGGEPVCEKPHQRGQGEPCSSARNCVQPLGCGPGRRCAPLLLEGEPCPGGFGCAAGLTCFKDPTNMTVTCRRLPV